jgi:hypothetical protein
MNRCRAFIFSISSVSPFPKELDAAMRGAFRRLLLCMRSLLHRGFNLLRRTPAAHVPRRFVGSRAHTPPMSAVPAASAAAAASAQTPRLDLGQKTCDTTRRKTAGRRERWADAVCFTCLLCSLPFACCAPVPVRAACCCVRVGERLRWGVRCGGASVSDKVDFAAEEHRVLSYWNDISAFETSLKQSEGKPIYTFYDGPPFATGLPHYGHILAGTIKDVVTRYAHQTGHHVVRRFGWDWSDGWTRAIASPRQSCAHSSAHCFLSWCVYASDCAAMAFPSSTRLIRSSASAQRRM